MDQLSAEQAAVLDALASGRNVLLTGAAGTGKSHALNHAVDWALAHGVVTARTAMTGAAALLIGGRTLHSFLGAGLFKGEPSELARMIKPPTKKRLRAVKLLVIDEVSMCDAELFEKASRTLCIVRGCAAPFGGIQLLLVGDFCQLPPVRGGFAFTAGEWKRANPIVVDLTRTFRQSEDAAFATLLGRARFGKLKNGDLAVLAACHATEFAPGVEPTRLYATNANVDRINEQHLAALLSDGRPTVTYKSVYSNAASKRWAESVGVPDSVSLCVGAQVVVTYNVAADQGLVNGTRGVVIGLETPVDVVIRVATGEVRRVPYATVTSSDEQGTTACSARYMPLRLAYAVTVHRSQGMTLDAVEVDLGASIFEYGQAYTALSRARSLASVRVASVDPASFRTHPQVIEFYQSNAANDVTALMSNVTL